MCAGVRASIPGERLPIDAEARFAIEREMARSPKLTVTLANPADDHLLNELIP